MFGADITGPGLRFFRRADISGADLRFLRRAREVPLAEVARRWPCTRNNVMRVESSRRPRPATIDRFLKALEAAERERQ